MSPHSSNLSLHLQKGKMVILLRVRWFIHRDDFFHIFIRFWLWSCQRSCAFSIVRVWKNVQKDQISHEIDKKKKPNFTLNSKLGKKLNISKNVNRFLVINNLSKQIICTPIKSNNIHFPLSKIYQFLDIFWIYLDFVLHELEESGLFIKWTFVYSLSHSFFYIYYFLKQKKIDKENVKCKYIATNFHLFVCCDTLRSFHSIIAFYFWKKIYFIIGFCCLSNK